MPEGTVNASQMVEKFIALRNKISEIKEAHKKQLAPYNDALGQLEGLLMQQLDAAGMSSMKGSAGTVYKSTTTSVTVDDWTSTFGYIKDNQLWDLLEARVSKTAALAVIEERQAPIPGVKVSQMTGLHVRKS